MHNASDDNIRQLRNLNDWHSMTGEEFEMIIMKYIMDHNEKVNTSHDDEFTNDIIFNMTKRNRENNIFCMRSIFGRF